MSEISWYLTRAKLNCTHISQGILFALYGQSRVNSLWHIDVLWRYRSRSTLALVMAWCLTAPSHYRNQCWLIIKYVLWHSHQSHLGNAHDINLFDEFKNLVKFLNNWHIFHEPMTLINSLWPSDAIWRQGSWSAMDLVIICCLMAPSHYLNQCWLITSWVLWHSPKTNFTGIAQDINL